MVKARIPTVSITVIIAMQVGDQPCGPQNQRDKAENRNGDLVHEIALPVQTVHNNEEHHAASANSMVPGTA